MRTPLQRSVLNGNLPDYCGESCQPPFVILSCLPLQSRYNLLYHKYHPLQFCMPSCASCVPGTSGARHTLFRCPVRLLYFLSYFRCLNSSLFPIVSRPDNSSFSLRDISQMSSIRTMCRSVALGRESWPRSFAQTCRTWFRTAPAG